MIAIGEQLVAGTPADAAYLPALINLTASGYMMRFIHDGNEEDLEVALITPKFHSWKAYLTTLSGVLQARFERIEDLADLERAKQLRAML